MALRDSERRHGFDFPVALLSNIVEDSAGHAAEGAIADGHYPLTAVPVIPARRHKAEGSSANLDARRP